MLVLCLSFSIALIDQATKLLVCSNFFRGDYISVIPGFWDLRYIQNTGAAWGILSGFNRWLILLSVAMVIVIIKLRHYFLSSTPVHRIVMGLMIGGIVGNLVDRLKFGYVVDFLDFHWHGHPFPAFNVADSAICMGVGLYILTQIFLGTSESKTASAETKAQPDSSTSTLQGE
jgi:signal peptidase II